MVNVSISTFGSVNKEVGWSCKELSLAQEGVTVEDVLKSVRLRDGRILFDLVGDESGIKDNYTILLNGRPLWNPKDLKTEVRSEDLVTAMDILQAIGGG